MINDKLSADEIHSRKFINVSTKGEVRGCDREDCLYYYRYEDFVEKCSECLENCNIKSSIGFNHFECE